jgi:hypothetical protein
MKNPILLSLLLGASNAFVVPIHTRVPPRMFRMAADGTPDNDDRATELIKPDGVEEGSHAELMYTLGVNLARQLGDVRPLVENGEELAQVARGLLDTVIGRFEQEGQRALLARRGAELNELITYRA